MNEQELPDGPVGMEAIEDSQPTAGPVTPQLKPDELVSRVLFSRFGNRWTPQLKVQMSGQDLYCVLRLAMWGLESRETELMAVPSKDRDIGTIISIASWASNVEDFANAIAVGEEVKVKKSRRK